MAKAILEKQPIHLGLGARAEIEPEFTGDMAWYGGYSERHEATDGREARLVAEHRFTDNWDSWECHPEGDEAVYCLSGAMTLIQEQSDGEITHISLEPGEYAINPAGVWHTADIENEARALFITAGRGTQHRSR